MSDSQKNQAEQVNRAVQPRKGIASLASEDFSVLGSIGGVRGVIESVAPLLVLILAFGITHNLSITIVVSLVLCAVEVIARVVQKQPLSSALSGLVTVGLCLIVAWFSQSARNYFLPGLVINAVAVLVLVVSLLMRIPAIGCIVEFFRGGVLKNEEDANNFSLKTWLSGWIFDKSLHSAYMKATGVWIGVFAIRLVVEVPMYLNDAVEWLGAAKIALGVPLFALAIWITWLIISPFTRKTSQKVSQKVFQKTTDEDSSNSEE